MFITVDQGPRRLRHTRGGGGYHLEQDGEEDEVNKLFDKHDADKDEISQKVLRRLSRSRDLGPELEKSTSNVCAVVCVRRLSRLRGCAIECSWLVCRVAG